MKAVEAVCPSCGSVFLWRTERSWWLFWDRCYACPGGNRINDLPFPWEEIFVTRVSRDKNLFTQPFPWEEQQ